MSGKKPAKTPEKADFLHRGSVSGRYRVGRKVPGRQEPERCRGNLLDLRIAPVVIRRSI
jgi:hypothetical protein